MCLRCVCERIRFTRSSHVSLNQACITFYLMSYTSKNELMSYLVMSLVDVDELVDVDVLKS